MFWKKKKGVDAQEAARLISSTVAGFMDIQLKIAKVYGYSELTRAQQNVAEVLALGAIDYMSQVLKGDHETQVLIGLANVLPSTFGYSSVEASHRAGLLPAAYDSQSGMQIMKAGGEGIKYLMEASRSENKEDLSKISYQLVNLLRSEVRIDI